MKNEDVMATILGEVTGKPKQEIQMRLNWVKNHRPESRAGLEQEISEADADKLLTALRKEKSGILNWLLEGLRQNLDDTK